MNKVEKEIFIKLRSIAKENGFDIDKNNNYISRCIDNNNEVIGCNISYIRGEYNGTIVYYKYIHNVECYLEKYYSELNLTYRGGGSETILFGESFANEALKDKLNDISQIPIEDTTEGISAFCDLLEYNITEKILSLAERFNDIHYLERQVRAALKNYTDFSLQNRQENLYTFFNPVAYEFRILIIAKLAGVSEYETIYQKLLYNAERLSDSDDYFKQYPIVLKELKNDLDVVQKYKI